MLRLRSKFLVTLLLMIIVVFLLVELFKTNTGKNSVQEMQYLQKIVEISLTSSPAAINNIYTHVKQVKLIILILI